MGVRIVLSAVALVAYALLNGFWQSVRSSYQASAAVNQLEDSAVTYGLSRWFATNDAIGPLLFIGFVLFLLILWWGPIRRRGNSTNIPAIAAMLLVGLTTTACLGPAEVPPIEEIGPSETAFLIPLEGATKDDQGRFMSVEYLQENKVASKRVTLPVRKRTIGRGPGNFEWIPTARVIRVDRKPVVREWTKQPATGTSARDEAIKVETVQSIEFSVGVVASVSIREEDAATFLYFFAGKPLEEIMDQNVRGFVQGELFERFGQLTLDVSRETKNEVINATEAAAKAFFKPMGVTVDYIGGSEGLTYNNQAIQQAIDATFNQEQGILTANARATQQHVDNVRELAVAGNEAAKKATQAAGDAAAIQQTGQMLQTYPSYLELRRLEVEASKVDQWNGQWPQVVGSGGELATLFAVGALQQPVPR